MRVEFLGEEPAPNHRTVLVAFFLQDEGPWAAHAGRNTVAINRLTSTAERSGFTGKGETVLNVAANLELGHEVVLVGIGPREELTQSAIEDAGARAFSAVGDREFETIILLLSAAETEQAAHAALGVRLAAYKFDKYHTKKKRKAPEFLTVLTNDPAAAKRAYEPLAAVAEGIYFARDLVSEPPNLLYPASFVDRLRSLEKKGIDVSAIGEAEMATRGMGSLLAVGQGSGRESQLAICKWMGARGRNSAPIVFVGKGVTFDSGGLSLKPTKDMELMKMDMGGAAAVAGALLALAQRRSAVNAIGVLGLVENMPDGNALRVSDILTSMSGQTIEVVNTDAEGRLVLADALWFAQQEFKPRAMIDLATLTGHASYALGNDCAALMSNNDELSEQLIDAAAHEHEMLWRLPLIDAYDKLHDTLHADMKNVGGHPEAGAITAALFLQRFVNGVPWAHLDIESVAWRTRKDRPTIPEGATGFGVRTLNRLVADYFEEAD